MGTHSYHHSPESGNFIVGKKDGDKFEILHTFPSEGEAALQVQYLDEREAAAEPAAEAKAKKPDPRSEDNHRYTRHR